MHGPDLWMDLHGILKSVVGNGCCTATGITMKDNKEGNSSSGLNSEPCI